MTLEKYKSILFWPLNFLAIAYVIAFTCNNFHLQIAEKNAVLFQSVDNLVWIIFSLDYFTMLFLSKNKKSFIKFHIIDLILVVFPFIRILRILRLLTLLTKQFNNVKQRIFISVPIYTTTAAGLLILLGGALIYDIEYMREGSNIKTPSDALWWAAVTITTVGYGDRYPVSNEGRLLGVGLMICGIAVVGTVTANFAGWIISQIKEAENENQKIELELAEIKRILNSDK